MRFLDWLHRLRDFDIENSIKELRDSEDEWERYEDSEIVQDSFLENSRISVNITPIKKQLSESLHQISMENGTLDSCNLVSAQDYKRSNALGTRKFD